MICVFENLCQTYHNQDPQMIKYIVEHSSPYELDTS